MASTAIKKESEKREYFDTPEVLDEKITALAEMIVTSQHMVAFTGAGISTASGIPDYRSGMNTCLPTGPGCWETAANKQKYKDGMKKRGRSLPPAQTRSFNVTIGQAKPSLTHMALVELMNQDHLKCVVSQNIDGLHRKSGIDPDKLAELHGNTNLELCTKCGGEQMRDFRVRCAAKATAHQTGRICERSGCKGKLKDSIINFGDNLESHILQKSSDNCDEADLVICMGSSMRVNPACDLPYQTVDNGGNCVMINLQKTPADKYATLCIYGKCDDIIKLLMQKLEYDIPKFTLKRRLKVKYDKQNKQVSLCGVDMNGARFTFHKRIDVKGLGPMSSNVSSFSQSNFMPFKVAIDQKRKITAFVVKMSFIANYGEPDLSLTVPMELLTGLG